MKKRWYILPLLFLSTVLTAEEFTIEDLSGGMYSNYSANQIPDNAAVRIQNFFTDVQPLAIERNGYEKRDSTQLGEPNAVTGLWEFQDNSGNQWIISYSSRTFYKNTIGNTPTAFGLSATVSQIPECAINLGKIWCVNGTDYLWWFDGSSTGSVSGAPLGKLIVPWRNRIVIGWITGSLSTVRFSEDGDGTNWTLGGNATDPFSIQIGGANDGYNTTCMWGSYLDNLIIARKYDIWAVAGFDQLDIVTRNVSDEIGCIQDGSMREFDGSLIFMSNRGMEEMRGAVIQHISESIRDITDTIVSNTSEDRRNTQTSQSDWDAGTQSPSSWFDTTIVSGDLELATTTAISDLVDASSTNFVNGTFSSTQRKNNIVHLSSASQTLKDSYFTSCSGGTGTFDFFAWSFTAGSSYDAMLIKTYGWRTTATGEVKISLYSDDSFTLGTELSSTIIDVNDYGTSCTEIDIFLPAPISLTSGTRYWIKVDPTSSTGLIMARDSRISSEKWTINDVTYNSNADVLFKVYSGEYATSGTFTSRAFNTSVSTANWIWSWTNFSPTATDGGGSITYETQVSSDSSTWSSLQSVTAESAPQSSSGQYFRYKVTMSSGTGSPTLSTVTITSNQRRRPTAVFTSQVYTIGDDISSWGPIAIEDNIDTGNSIVYQFNSTDSADINDFSATNWETVTSGAVPTISTGAYAAFRATFTVVNSTNNCSLQSFQTAWSEGTGAQPVVSQNVNRRYWLSYTTNTANDSRNDRILVYQRNHTWSLLKGINASSFATWRDQLYFGDSNDNGYVYKYGSVSNDDGSDIDSIIVTKSYDLGNFSFQKRYGWLYTNFNSDSNNTGSFVVKYDLDQSGTFTSLGTMAMTDVQPADPQKLPFSISNRVEGREIQYAISKSGQDTRLKLYDLTTIYDLKRRR